MKKTNLPIWSASPLGKVPKMQDRPRLPIPAQGLAEISVRVAGDSTLRAEITKRPTVLFEDPALSTLWPEEDKQGPWFDHLTSPSLHCGPRGGGGVVAAVNAVANANAVVNVNAATKVNAVAAVNAVALTNVLAVSKFIAKTKWLIWGFDYFNSYSMDSVIINKV